MKDEYKRASKSEWGSKARKEAGRLGKASLKAETRKLAREAAGPLPEPEFREASQELVLAAVAMKNELFRLGLYQSAHLMDRVTTKLGWELAEKIKKDY